MKKFAWALAILVTVFILAACEGKPRGDTDNQSVSDTVEKFVTQSTVVLDKVEEATPIPSETQFNVVDADTEVAKPTTIVQPLQVMHTDEVVYKCVNKENATCSNNIQIPFLTKVNLILTDVSVGGVRLNSLPFSIQFAVKDHGLKQIISEMTSTGNGGVLSISKEALWQKYGNVVFEKIIRKFLSDKNLASVLSLRKDDWNELLDILKTDTWKSPIEIIEVSGNIENVFIKAPILIAN